MTTSSLHPDVSPTHRGHGRVVCPHGALISTCRCIGAAKRTHVVSVCPTHCPFSQPPAGKPQEGPR